MLAQALIIDEPWIDHIMAGRKTWEMRSRRTTKRGPIALVRKGSGQIVAIADIVDCLAPLGTGEMAASFDLHRIPQAMVERPGYKWFTPWVLANVRLLEEPVSYRHPPGAVTWVSLAPDVQAALAKAGRRSVADSSSTATGRGVGPVRSAHSSNIANSAANPETPARQADRAKAGDRTWARMVLDDLRDGPNKLDIPRHAAVSVARHGRKLHIDAMWDDGKPAKPMRPTRWRDIVGIFSALGAALCMLTFVIMIMVGIATWSGTFFHAFYALPPMLVFVLIATVTGHADLLPDFNERHDRRGKSR